MDSRTTIAPFLRFLPTISAADSVSIFSKGFCEAKKKRKHFFSKGFCFAKKFLFSVSIFSLSTSNPIVFKCFENASANGKPT